MPDFLFAADVNRDRKPDVVFYSQETVDGPVVFLGDGGGTIRFLGKGPVIPFTPYIAVGDVDGDGIPDVVTAQHFSAGQSLGGITVLHGNGDGTFRQTYQHQFPTPDVETGGIAIADVNHDGNADILLTDSFHATFYLFLGLGGGTFQLLSMPLPSIGSSQIATGDFDGDGNLDVAIAISFTDSTGSLPVYYSAVSFMFGAGDGTFRSSVMLQLPGLFPFSMAAADFDGDGATDRAIAGAYNVPPKMIWGSKTRQLAAVAIPGAPTGLCLLAADLDGDGFPDLVNTCTTADVFLNRGGRNFQKIYSFSSSLGLWTSIAADMNGDGKPDIVSIAGNPRGLNVFLNQLSPWTAQLSASLSSLLYGEAVTITASFSPGANSFQSPTGVVTWMTGNTTLGTSQLNQTGSSYTSTFTFSPLPGTYEVTMKCVGAAPSNSVKLNVAKAQASLAASAGNTAAGPGSPIALTASVSAQPPATGTPTGTIIVTEAGTQLGLFAVDSTGHAQGAIREIVSGAHTLLLNYSGDTNFVPSSTTVTVLVEGALAVVSAADGVSSVAPGSIVSVYGANFSSSTLAATSVPLSTTQIGVEVTFIDSKGASMLAPIYLVSPGQINAVVPQIAPGTASVQVTSYGLPQATGTASIAAAAPALFSANATGTGVAAATLLTIDSTGATSSQLVFSCGTIPGSCVATPLDLSDPSKQYYLVLYGTGLGGASATSQLQGAPAPVLYSGPQGQYPGLDQINVQLPRGVSGLGPLDVAIAIGSQISNHLGIFVK